MKNQNQNANETDIEKQFKEDLEKATALSLETLALEEFHRNKSLQSSGSSVIDGGGGGSSGSSNSPSTSGFMKFSTCMYSSRENIPKMEINLCYCFCIIFFSSLSRFSAKQFVIDKHKIQSIGDPTTTRFIW